MGMLAMACVAVVVYLLCGDAALGVSLAIPVIAGTVSTQTTQEAASEMGEDIVMSDVERKVTNLRPDIAPLDSMIRQMDKVKTNSFEVKWGESNFGDGYVQTLSAVSQNNPDATLTIPLSPATYKFAVDSSVFLYKDADIGKYVGLYVIAKNSTTQEIICRVIGGAGAGDQIGASGIAASTDLYFNGIAKNELDAQTEAFQKMPELYFNYCQIQMCQIEQGFYDQKQKKELDWSLIEFKSDAMYKFRYGCETTALMGIKSKTTDKEGQDVYTAGGLENYVGWHLKYVPDAAGNAGGLDMNKFIEIGEAVFTNVAGSDSRVFFMSPQLMTAFLKNIAFRKMVEQAKTEIVYGIRCKQIETGHGLLNIRSHKGLGLSRRGQGAIVDLSRIRQRPFNPLGWRDVELAKSGQKLADAWVLEERSSFEFRAATTHAWVYPVLNASEAGVVEL